MDYFVAQLGIVLPILGLDLFRRVQVEGATGTPSTEASGNPTFVFSTAGASATARETDKGFVVLAGSTCRRTPSGTFPVGYLVLRESADHRWTAGR